MPKDSIAAVAGPAGVGAICILGVFLFLDGRAPELFPTVETYAKTATWGIVAAVPVLVMAYVLGLFLISGAELAVQFTFGPGFEREAADIARLAAISAEKSAAVQAYIQLRQDRAVLAGSAVAFVVLFAGAISEIRNLSHLKGTIALLGIGTLLLAGRSDVLFRGQKERRGTLLGGAGRGVRAGEWISALYPLKPNTGMLAPR